MILIVDDKEENLFSLKSFLRQNAYDVDPSSSGQDALKKILRNEYTLIILDESHVHAHALNRELGVG